MLTLGSVTHKIRKGTFTGICHADRLLGSIKMDAAEARPEHPTINWSDRAIIGTKNQRWNCVGVTCPQCSTKRYVRPNQLAMKMREGKHTGLCRQCGRAGRDEVANPELSPGRFWQRRQYIYLERRAVPQEHMALFLEMCGKTRMRVAEHRFVMAVALMRPLTSNELVDHMDGVKTNNELSNLRIYRKGRNDPGSHNGYGTFYHEWQVALAEIVRLESRLTAAGLETD